MSAYASAPGLPKNVVMGSDNRSMLMSSSGRTTSQKAETRGVHGSMLSGALVAAFFAFMNVGASTTPGHNNLNTVKPSVMPVFTRANVSDGEDDNVAQDSDELQKMLGLNTSQWAKILKVERKTVYNWRKSPETKIKTNAAKRLEVISKFAEEFNPSHSDYFSKFIFGRNADKGLLNAFLKDPLDLQDLLNQYDNLYTKLDGYVKRAILLGK
ncbi:hypothetical protein DN590_19310 [Citrobacter freundii]|nr:hypothetical protein DN590_19310 [Citrobacter freundii]